MNDSRRFSLLYVGIFIAYTIIMLFFSIRDMNQHRSHISNQEMPALGLAVTARLQVTTSQYKKAGEELLQDNYIRDWILDDEKDSKKLISFLKNIQYDFEPHLLDASVVSDPSETYYCSDGRILKLSPNNIKRDGWYYYYRENVPMINIDSWYYPETGIIGIYINVPIYDKDNRYIGVTGGGIDSYLFTKTLHTIEETSSVNIYMIRSDGQIVYSSKKELLNGSKHKINEVWSTPVFDLLQRSRNFNEGIILEPDGSKGAILWTRYVTDWDTYIIVERDAKSLRSLLLPSFIRSIVAGSILVLLLLFITGYEFHLFYKRFNTNIVQNRDAIHRLQAVIDAQGRLLKTAESWLITFGGTLIYKNPENLTGQDALERGSYIQQARKGLRTALYANENEQITEIVPLYSIIEQVITKISGDFSRRGVQLHTQTDTSIHINTHGVLVRLVLEDLLLQILEQTDFNGDITVSVHKDAGMPTISIAGAFLGYNIIEERLSMTHMILQSLHADMNRYPVEDSNCVFCIQFKTIEKKQLVLP